MSVSYLRFSGDPNDRFCVSDASSLMMYTYAFKPDNTYVEHLANLSSSGEYGYFVYRYYIQPMRNGKFIAVRPTNRALGIPYVINGNYLYVFMPSEYMSNSNYVNSEGASNIFHDFIIYHIGLVASSEANYGVKIFDKHQVPIFHSANPLLAFENYKLFDIDNIGTSGTALLLNVDINNSCIMQTIINPNDGFYFYVLDSSGNLYIKKLDRTLNCGWSFAMSMPVMDFVHVVVFRNNNCAYIDDDYICLNDGQIIGTVADYLKDYFGSSNRSYPTPYVEASYSILLPIGAGTNISLETSQFGVASISSRSGATLDVRGIPWSTDVNISSTNYIITPLIVDADNLKNVIYTISRDTRIKLTGINPSPIFQNIFYKTNCTLKNGSIIDEDGNTVNFKSSSSSPIKDAIAQNGIESGSSWGYICIVKSEKYGIIYKNIDIPYADTLSTKDLMSLFVNKHNGISDIMVSVDAIQLSSQLYQTINIPVNSYVVLQASFDDAARTILHKIHVKNTTISIKPFFVLHKICSTSLDLNIIKPNLPQPQDAVTGLTIINSSITPAATITNNCDELGITASFSYDNDVLKLTLYFSSGTAIGYVYASEYNEYDTQEYQIRYYDSRYDKYYYGRINSVADTWQNNNIDGNAVPYYKYVIIHNGTIVFALSSHDVYGSSTTFARIGWGAANVSYMQSLYKQYGSNNVTGLTLKLLLSEPTSGLIIK